MSKDNRIIIRVADPSDAEKLLAIYRPYVEKTAITFEYDVPTVGEFRERIRNTLIRFPYYVAERNGEPVGYAYAGCFKDRAAYDWAVETSIYVDEGCRRMGTGAKLYAALEHALGTMGILNVEACIAYPEAEDEYLSTDSVLFHSHLGYRMVGEFRKCGYKFGRWYNMVWMEKFIGEHMNPQEPIRPFPEICRDTQQMSMCSTNQSTM